jgi:hypothetical protein
MNWREIVRRQSWPSAGWMETSVWNVWGITAEYNRCRAWGSKKHLCNKSLFTDLHIVLLIASSIWYSSFGINDDEMCRSWRSPLRSFSINLLGSTDCPMGSMRVRDCYPQFPVNRIACKLAGVEPRFHGVVFLSLDSEEGQSLCGDIADCCTLSGVRHRLMQFCHIWQHCVIDDWIPPLHLCINFNVGHAEYILRTPTVLIILGVFAKLRKVTTSFVMSVRLYGTTRLPLGGFSWN